MGLSARAKGSNRCWTLSDEHTMLAGDTGLLTAVNSPFLSISSSLCLVSQLTLSPLSAEAGGLLAAGEDCQIWPVV